MVLSERELRILRSLEDSLQDCERRFAAIERRARRRRLRLITLCLAALITGVDLVLLGAIVGTGGIGLTIAGSVELATACGWLGVLLYRYLRRLCEQMTRN